MVVVIPACREACNELKEYVLYTTLLGATCCFTVYGITQNRHGHELGGLGMINGRLLCVCVWVKLKTMRPDNNEVATD